MILDRFPSAEEFYKTYWNKKPFVVKGAIKASLFDELVDGDTLAGLALEEDIKSRIVLTSEEGDAWTCEHGPFEEERFSTLGEKNWALLVQNVEQYHTDTAQLLSFFDIAPRWLMDDIMVSYSAPQGSVGPHTDSYHVFLVQGIGKRQWKISDAPIENGEYIEGQDLKVLKNSFEGQTIDTEMGDILYIPPHFAHEGTTTEAAMTFSIGFLGPTASEMLIEFGYHLEQTQTQNKRYCGQGLGTDSAGFSIGQNAQRTVQNDLVSAIQSDEFAIWMAEYFSAPTHNEFESLETQDEPLTSAALQKRLENGEALYKPEHVKITSTISSDGTLTLAAFGKTLSSSSPDHEIIAWLKQGTHLSITELKALTNADDALHILTALYNQNVLRFEER